MSKSLLLRTSLSSLRLLRNSSSISISFSSLLSLLPNPPHQGLRIVLPSYNYKLVASTSRPCSHVAAACSSSESESDINDDLSKALSPHILDVRKDKFRNVVTNRTYSLCLVVEGLCDFGNVSATFRSADALGFQSVHVVSCDSKRYKDNRHVSMGAEKWLDIELWSSIHECFKVLKARGYRIATTHVGMDAVSIYDMDWSHPTAIVVGNENRGISDEALELSDLHCSIPMKGMVDSFNVSVAAGILMHHAVCDRTSRLGCHGDLTSKESQILLAEFSLRHSKSALSIAHEYAKRKAVMCAPKL
ncbi:trna (guanosine(18)-2'-o)-methyltransferase [Quercus suber]|uniref:Trna (Guanosine(18)-2'-o)-methyltransferase n=1 Tax=Quercus suber TaxID=58331 RepID=A0AAW0KY17_QUESU